MSENVEITLNGVNVTGCKYLYNSKEGLLCTIYDYNVFCEMRRCADNPDCYYKQLQREKQKNKKLTEDFNELCKRHNEAFEEFNKLKQTNEKLRKILKEIEEYINNFCDNCDWDKTDVDCESSCRLDEITNPILEKVKGVEK